MRAVSFKKEVLLSLAIVIFSLFASAYIVFAQVETDSPHDCAARPSGLVSWWDGDSTTGALAKDLSDNNDGILTRDATTVAGKFGRAFNFVGTGNSYIDASGLESKLTINQLTIAAWVKPTAYPKGCCVHIVGLDTPGTWMTHIGIDGDPKRPYLWTRNGIYLHDTSPLLLGEWQHIAATYDGTTAKWYTNGALKAEQLISISLPIGTLTRVGGSAVELRPFNGLVDDVEIYNSAKAASEIQAIFNAGGKGKCNVPPPPPPPPVEEKGVTYPVKELGSCKNEAECHVYCDQPENSRACLVFVKKHKLLSEEEIKKWEEFIDVASGEGPGSCKNEKECISYCEDGSHIAICTNFVAKHNLVSGDELAEMQKIAKAVKAGAHLPGNCRGKAACVSYCENPANIDECLVFAEKAELFSPGEIAEAKKVAPFIKSGTTPGGCKSKAECLTYCADDSRFEECTSFIEKAGFVSQKQADFLRKSKGKSPGNCAKGKTSFEDAQKSCNAFCNDPTNQPVCFRFLEEAGIMTVEEATQAGSMSDFQACIPSAPEEIKQCFITNLGPDLFAAMQQGAMPLAEDIQDMMVKIREARKCVNRYTNESLATLTDNPNALDCIDSQLGNDYLKRAKRGDVKCGDAAQSQQKIESCVEGAISAKLDHCFSLACSEATTCLQSFQKPGKGKGGEKLINSDLKEKIEGKIKACVTEELQGCLAKDCSEMMSCINKLQSQAGDEKGESALDPALEQELTAKMTICTKQDQNGGGESSQQPAPYQEPQGQPPQPEQYPSPDQNPQRGDRIPQEYCSGFASVPSCSYVGSPDSQNYQYCKQCYPDR